MNGTSKPKLTHSRSTSVVVPDSDVNSKTKAERWSRYDDNFNSASHTDIRNGFQLRNTNSANSNNAASNNTNGTSEHTNVNVSNRYQQPRTTSAMHNNNSNLNNLNNQNNYYQAPNMPAQHQISTRNVRNSNYNARQPANVNFQARPRQPINF